MTKKLETKRIVKCYLHREFEIWYEKNGNKFTNKPYFFKSTIYGSEYRFEGVSSKLSLYMDHCGQFLITCYYRNQMQDIIVEFDAYAEKTKSGKYFCSFCKAEYRKYYSSKSALLRAHCFKQLVEWCNKNLVEDKSILILGQPRGWSSANIMDTSAANRKKKYVKFRSPVLIEAKTKGK